MFYFTLSEQFLYLFLLYKFDFSDVYPVLGIFFKNLYYVYPYYLNFHFYPVNQIYLILTD